MATYSRQISLANGVILHSKYRIQSILGRGGFSITYSAMDIQFERLVAIKEYFPQNLTIREGNDVLPNDKLTEESFKDGLKSFLEEAKNLARFKHPNICTIFDFFQENGTAYLVMPYLEGQTLESLLKKYPNETMSCKDILQWLPDLLDALQTLHSQGILHRDIKPSNIYITTNNKPILIDFGAARNAFERTHGYTIILTPEYAPPEQNSSDIQSQGPWTDIYALAAVIWRCIMGSPPPSAQERLCAVASGDKDPIDLLKDNFNNKVSPGLFECIIKSLSFGYRTRIQGIREFKEYIISEEKQDQDLQPETNQEEHSINNDSNILEQSSNLDSKLKFLFFIIIIIVILIIFKIGPFNFDMFSDPNKSYYFGLGDNYVEIDLCKAMQADLNDGMYFYNNKNYESAMFSLERVVNSKCTNLDKDPLRAIAANGIGAMYKMGQGTTVNNDLAFQSFKYAADLGNSAAQYNLARMYLFGDGIPKDTKSGIFYLELAELHDNIDAMALLAYIYETGEFGATKHRERAFDIYRRGVEELKSDNKYIVEGYNRLKKYYK